MNNDQDPFFEDRTVIKPVPGGRREDLQQTITTSRDFVAPSAGTSLQKLGSINPLEKAASALLALVSQLARSPSHPSPQQLKRQLGQELQTFNAESEAARYDSTTRKYASYSLCTALDEAILNTPWGAQSGWGGASLLSAFHGDVSGGEQFFTNLKTLSQNPAKNLHLLELKYLCLALGFQGRYRHDSNGRENLAKIRTWLSDLLRKQNGKPESALSPHWRGVSRMDSVTKSIPLWLIALGSSALLLLFFVVLFFWLSANATPAQNGIVQVQVPSVELPDFSPPPVAGPIPEPEPDPKPVLEDVDNDQVTINNGKITLKGKYSFASGKAALSDGILPTIKQLAEALNKSEGRISVIGHTDNIPIRRSLRFPDNAVLSKARATAVADAMRQYLDDKTRLMIEGRGDAEPISDNTTKDGRRINRRVEIILNQ